MDFQPPLNPRQTTVLMYTVRSESTRSRLISTSVPLGVAPRYVRLSGSSASWQMRRSRTPAQDRRRSASPAPRG